ncbi:MAG: NAD(P)-dependent alcohol dehydrogenase [bacterium]
MTQPGSGEVLLRIEAAAVSATDTIMRRGRPWPARMAMGLFRPGKPILGTEFCGTVEAVGSKVERFIKGDRLVGASGDSFGAHAQFILQKEDAVLAQIPPAVSPAEMLAISEGALTALPFLRDGGSIRRGMQVLVIGASGSVGTAAVQLAEHFGAVVTGVCGAGNAELVKSLGASHVIDYRSEDFTKGAERYDIILDTVGSSSFPQARKVLKPGGVYLTTMLSLPILMQMLFTSRSRGQRAKILFAGMREAKLRAKDLRYICDLAARGELRPVIDSRYPLEQVAAAHARVDSGHKRGSVLLDMPA